MKIKILGPGCQNCKILHDLVSEVLRSENIEADLEYITDMTEIQKYIMITPGFVIDGEVVHQGKPLPDLEKVKELILASIDD